VGMIIKGVKTITINIEKKILKIKELDISKENDIKIKRIKSIYVLTKEFSIPEIDDISDIKTIETKTINANIKELKESTKDKEPQTRTYQKLKIDTKNKQLKIKPIEPSPIRNLRVLFEAKLHSIHKLEVKEPKTNFLPVDKVKTPLIKFENTVFKTFTKKRSPSFPTNLPVEKKPTSLLFFSERELSILKRKLAEKHKINIQLIKLTSVYNKLNVSNIQNLKYDPNTGNVYYTFKPNPSKDETMAMMVFAIRRDTKASISTMVNASDLKQA
ncbi:MAG: hypothetical protein AB7V50_04635, partial [Vampirovibrionia bacterium]